MRSFQSIIAAGVCVMIPVLSLAQEEELTMEVIESIDEISTHHRILLPDHTKVADINDQQSGGNTDYSQQREQLNALIAEGDKSNRQSDIAQQQEHGQNTSGAAVAGNADKQLKEAVASYRKEMAERSQDIVDELREDSEQATTAATAATLSDE